MPVMSCVSQLLFLALSFHLGSATVSLSPGPIAFVCPKGNITLTCTTDDGKLKWGVCNVTEVFSQEFTMARRCGLFDLRLQSIDISGLNIVSTATLTNARVGEPLINGFGVNCADNSGNASYNIIQLQAPPETPTVYRVLVSDSGAAHLIWTPVTCGVKYLLTITSCPRSEASVLLQRNYTSSNITVQLPQEKTRDGICAAVRSFDAADRISIFYNNTNCQCVSTSTPQVTLSVPVVVGIVVGATAGGALILVVVTTIIIIIVVIVVVANKGSSSKHRQKQSDETAALACSQPEGSEKVPLEGVVM